MTKINVLIQRTALLFFKGADCVEVSVDRHAQFMAILRVWHLGDVEFAQALQVAIIQALVEVALSVEPMSTHALASADRPWAFFTSLRTVLSGTERLIAPIPAARPVRGRIVHDLHG